MTDILDDLELYEKQARSEIASWPLPTPEDSKAFFDSPHPLAKQEELSSSDEWSTPRVIFEQLHEKYRFTLDGAASGLNARLPNYLTKEMDALSLNVGKHRVWLNPPYSRGNLYRFVTWARRQAQKGALVCCLVPAYTCERWWQNSVFNADAMDLGGYVGTEGDTDEIGLWTTYRWKSLEVSVHFPAGRLKFVEASGATGPARFSSAVLVFEPPGGRQDS